MNIETLRPIARSLLRSYQVKSSRSADLATALMRGKACSWEEGNKLCVEGDDAADMFIILKGKIRVSRKSPSGEDKVLVILEAPTMIGHMGLVDGSTRSATCTMSLGATGPRPRAPALRPSPPLRPGEGDAPPPDASTGAHTGVRRGHRRSH